VADTPAVTPVILITGFLGSGKTTLLQRLLADPALGDTAVLINEFGEIGLDHHLLQRVDDAIVLLQSGCLCCTIRGDLSLAMKDLHARRERGEVPWFKRLVVESTGLADPFPILSTVQADPVLRHHFRLGNVITTVDAVNGAAHLARHPESVKQVAIADRLVLSKTDLADDPTTVAVLAEVRRLNPSAPLWRSADVIDADALLSHDVFALATKSEQVERWFAQELALGQHHHDVNRHDASVHAFALVFEEALDWTMFGVWLSMLLNRHGPAVLRVKGILNVAGSETPVAVHGVQHLVHPPVHLAAWPDADRRSRLVFIVDGLARADIERSFRAFCRPGRAASHRTAVEAALPAPGS
jgi:G3E family GTPase